MSFEIKIITAQRAVTTTGTPEKIKESPEFLDNRVIAIRIRAKAGNTGNIYITNADDRASASTVGDIIEPGELYVLDVSDIFDAYLDLSKIWFDADVSGDAISYTAFKVIR